MATDTLASPATLNYGQTKDRTLADYRKALKKEGLLTSDSRVKERKKYGMAGARKRFQFSKR